MSSETQPFSSLQVKEFRYFLLMRLCIVLAWSMQFVLVEWEVYSITKSAWNLGLIGLLEVIPAIGTALFAGYFVDKNEKKKMLTICLIAMLFLQLVLAYVIFHGNEFSKSWILFSFYTVVFLGGFIRAFIIPSNFSLMALILPKKEYTNGAKWSSSTWQVAAVIGPSIAGFCIHGMGVFNSFLLVAFFMFLGLILLLFIEKKPVLFQDKGESIFTSLKEGIAFVFKNKTVLNALSLDMFAVLFGGCVALLPVFAQDILKVGSEGFGMLRAAPAIGGLVTMLAATFMPLNHNAGKKVLIAVFLFGIFNIIFGLSTNFYLSLTVLFLSGVADGISVVIRQTILQIYTPDTMRGRVSSVNSIFVGSSNELGAFESGLFSKWFGVVNAVVIGGAITVFVVIYTAIKAPKFRELQIEN